MQVGHQAVERLLVAFNGVDESVELNGGAPVQSAQHRLHDLQNSLVYRAQVAIANVDGFGALKVQF